VLAAPLDPRRQGMPSSAVIYGARLVSSNAQFGADQVGGSWDEGFIQTSELEHTIENERVRDSVGRFIGGAKYGPGDNFTFTYISKNATNTDFGRVTSSTVLVVDVNGVDKDFLMENLKRSSANTKFLEFTGTAFYSDDFTT
jgi:hypothetical protein